MKTTGFLITLANMQFGIFGSAQANSGDLPPETGQGFRDYLDYAVEAEALGYRSSFLVEHHFTGWNQVSATLMLQTALAMRTTTLRLGTAVIVLPWHNPVLLAEQAATLDLISGGRFDFGIGKGYRHNEFAGFRIPPEEAEARFEESVEVMTKASSSRERFSHHGKFWQFDDIVVEPPPSQKPHPPFWVAAGSEASIRTAAQRGFNLILDQYASPEQLGQRIALYRAERRRRPGRPRSRWRARPMWRTTGRTPRPRLRSRRPGPGAPSPSRRRRAARPAPMCWPMRRRRRAPRPMRCTARPTRSAAGLERCGRLASITSS